jgi:RNA ligase
MVLSKDQYMPEVEQGYVTRRVHPEDSDVVILNYTPKTVYERHWNEVTLLTRGLILNERTGETLALPMKKFFNYDEQGVPNKVDLSQKPEITVKMDGSLGISYRLDDGKIRWATRGSFTSEQAKVAQRIWDEKYNHSDLYISPQLTLLVEIISPATRVVVPYDFEDLVLIGANHIYPSHDFGYDTLEYFANQIGMRITERVDASFISILEHIKTMDYTNEGFVLRWDDGTRLKMKGQDYMRVHKALYGLSLNQKLECWLEDKTDDLIKAVPEEYRKEIEELIKYLNMMTDDLEKRIVGIYQALPKYPRKDYALAVQTYMPWIRPLLFKMYDGKLTRYDIKWCVSQTYKEEFGNAE